MTEHPEQIPLEFRADVEKVLTVLRANGASEVYLFGSVAAGTCRMDSDLDVAVCGIEAGRFFEVYSLAGRDLEHELDLIGLDHEEALGSFLRESGRLVRIG